MTFTPPTQQCTSTRRSSIVYLCYFLLLVIRPAITTAAFQDESTVLRDENEVGGDTVTHSLDPSASEFQSITNFLPTNPWELNPLESYGTYGRFPVAEGWYTSRYPFGVTKRTDGSFPLGFVGARGRRRLGGLAETLTKRQEDFPPGFMGSRGKRMRYANPRAQLALMESLNMMPTSVHEFGANSDTMLRKPNGKKSEGAQVYQNGFVGVRG